MWNLEVSETTFPDKLENKIFLDYFCLAKTSKIRLRIYLKITLLWLIIN